MSLVGVCRRGGQADRKRKGGTGFIGIPSAGTALHCYTQHPKSLRIIVLPVVSYAKTEEDMQRFHIKDADIGIVGCQDII